jgi:hypothetical protein
MFSQWFDSDIGRKLTDLSILQEHLAMRSFVRFMPMIAATCYLFSNIESAQASDTSLVLSAIEFKTKQFVDMFQASQAGVQSAPWIYIIPPTVVAALLGLFDLIARGDSSYIRSLFMDIYGEFEEIISSLHRWISGNSEYLDDTLAQIKRFFLDRFAPGLLIATIMQGWWTTATVVIILIIVVTFYGDRE